MPALSSRHDPPVTLAARSYEGHADLALMVALEQAIAAARWPGLPRWHSGDVIWNTYTLDPGSDRARLWFEGDSPVAYGLLTSPDEMEVAIHPAAPDADALLSDVATWGESTVRGWAKPGEPSTVGMLVKSSDSGLAEALAGRGYVRRDQGGIFMRRPLTTPVEGPPLPSGMRVGDCVDIDLDERAAAHRDAWGHLDHIGMPGVLSSFSNERYRRLRATPGYDPALDLVVLTSDDTVAACCICWVDNRNGSGLFEPVGTRVDYRRQGLARALVLEGLRRFRQRGLHTAYIGTASFNHPAAAAYLSCGFEVVDRASVYELDLTESRKATNTA